MLEQAADVPLAHLRQAGIAGGSANSGLPAFQIDWWQCMPEPLSP